MKRNPSDELAAVLRAATNLASLAGLPEADEATLLTALLMLKHEETNRAGEAAGIGPLPRVHPPEDALVGQQVPLAKRIVRLLDATQIYPDEGASVYQVARMLLKYADARLEDFVGLLLERGEWPAMDAMALIGPRARSSRLSRGGERTFIATGESAGAGTYELVVRESGWTVRASEYCVVLLGPGVMPSFDGDRGLFVRKGDELGRVAQIPLLSLPFGHGVHDFCPRCGKRLRKGARCPCGS